MKSRPPLRYPEFLEVRLPLTASPTAALSPEFAWSPDSPPPSDGNAQGNVPHAHDPQRSAMFRTVRVREQRKADARQRPRIELDGRLSPEVQDRLRAARERRAQLRQRQLPGNPPPAPPSGLDQGQPTVRLNFDVPAPPPLVVDPPAPVPTVPAPNPRPTNQPLLSESRRSDLVERAAARLPTVPETQPTLPRVKDFVTQNTETGLPDGGSVRPVNDTPTRPAADAAGRSDINSDGGSNAGAQGLAPATTPMPAPVTEDSGGAGGQPANATGDLSPGPTRDLVQRDESPVDVVDEVADDAATAHNAATSDFPHSAGIVAYLTETTPQVAELADGDAVWGGSLELTTPAVTLVDTLPPSLLAPDQTPAGEEYEADTPDDRLSSETTEPDGQQPEADSFAQSESDQAGEEQSAKTAGETAEQLGDASEQQTDDMLAPDDTETTDADAANEEPGGGDEPLDDEGSSEDSSEEREFGGSIELSELPESPRGRAERSTGAEVAAAVRVDVVVGGAARASRTAELVTLGQYDHEAAADSDFEDASSANSVEGPQQAEPVNWTGPTAEDGAEFPGDNEFAWTSAASWLAALCVLPTRRKSTDLHPAGELVRREIRRQARRRLDRAPVRGT